MVDDLLEVIPASQIRRRRHLFMGHRRNAPSRNNILGRHDDSAFLPRRHRMWLCPGAPTLPLLLLPPSRGRFTNRDIRRGECRRECLWRCPRVRTESYYVGDRALEIVVYTGRCADLFDGYCVVVSDARFAWEGQVFE
jgi:hypothetical protein